MPTLPRLLLIDDDPISREVMAIVLEMHGFPIAAAENGQQALTLLNETSQAAPQVILMDTQMPGLSGLGLIAALRDVSSARIVAISGSDPGPEIQSATDGFLLKPIDALDLEKFLQASVSPANLQASKKPESPAETLPLIDPAVLAKLTAMMPASSVREIYQAVAADLKTRLPLLQNALNADNAQEVRRIAHAIKGGCAMVGLSSAMDAASRLEFSNVPVTLPAELSRLHFALSGLERMLGEKFPPISPDPA